MTWIKYAFFTAFSFLVPIQSILLLLIGFVTIDTIMAIYVSVKTRGWNSFRSALLRKGMTAKVFLYLGTVILAYGIDLTMFGGTLFGIKLLLSKGLAGVWISAEVKSLDENSMKLGNRSFYTLVKDFFKRITGFKDEIKKITE